MNRQLQEKLNIQKLIGKGGFGNVYRALNHKINRFEAVKVSHPNQAGQMKLIRYEAGILNHLKGVKGVPEFYEYLEENDLQIIKMEYLGNDLDTVLR